MIHSFWRYSHLTLAISSFIFVLIAAVTGIILAFEPISKQISPYSIADINKIPLSKTITSLQKQYPEISSINVDRNHFVTASVVTKEGKSTSFYINPISGEKIGTIAKRKNIYKIATTIHRSLFLKSTGRIIVSFFSFILLLTTLSGVALIIKRQGGVTMFFSKVIKENPQQFYHIVIGRYALIPIILITVTGLLLSFDKFSLLPAKKNDLTTINTTHSNLDKKRINEINIFKSTYLNNLKSIEFPFSDDPEDPFFLELKNKELTIHQYTGNVLSETKYAVTGKLIDWSIILHTGDGTFIWALVLLGTCISLLFFIYSGCYLTYNRINNQPIIKNKFSKDTAEYILLVGSESGSTFSFANSLYNGLIKDKKTAYINHLNSYTHYKKAKYLFILTATYGDGDAPNNAKNFEKLIQENILESALKYAIIGFGSKAYSKFCSYAQKLDTLLQKDSNFTPILPIHKINNQSIESYKDWIANIEKALNTPIQITPIVTKKKQQQLFKVHKEISINNDHTFLLHLEPLKKISFTSGDLLSITPKNETAERLYSIGKVNNKIVISIKKHSTGICSTYLSNLKVNHQIQAAIKVNTHFHLPEKTKDIILIANGTGIGPFLGMIANNTKKVNMHLFWGGRNKHSFHLYEKHINEALSKNHLQSVHISYSQESKKQYIQEKIALNEEIIINTLTNNGCIMICGSILMKKDLFNIIRKITLSKLNIPLEHFISSNQIKTDCY